MTDIYKPGLEPSVSASIMHTISSIGTEVQTCNSAFVAKIAPLWNWANQSVTQSVAAIKNSFSFDSKRVAETLRSHPYILGFALTAIGVSYVAFKYITRLNKENDQLKAQLHQNEDTQQRLETLRTQNADPDAQVTRLSDRVTSLENINRDLEQQALNNATNYQNNLSQVRSLLEAEEAKNKQLQTSLQQALRENREKEESLQEQLATHQVKLQEAASKAQQDIHTITELKGTIERIQKELSENKETQDRLLKEKVQSAQEKKSLEEQNKKAEARNKQLEQDIQKLHQDIAEIAQLNSENKQNRAQPLLISSGIVSDDQMRFMEQPVEEKGAGEDLLNLGSGFEEMITSRLDIPPSFREFIANCCPEVIVEEAYKLYLQGENIYQRIQTSQEPITIDSEEKKHTIILPLIWYLIAVKQSFREGFITLDKDSKIFELLKTTPNIYQRWSSHVKDIKGTQYGIDFSPVMAKLLGLLLPLGKTTLLIIYDTENGRLHLKPEDYGLKKISDITPHLWQFVRNKAMRALPSILGSPDEGPYMRKEHLPYEVKQQFLRISSLLNTEAKHFNKSKTVYSIFADLIEWLQISELQISQDAEQEIKNFITNIKNRGWDHVDKRRGNEKILTESDLNPLDTHQRRPNPLAYVENLLKLNTARNKTEFLSALSSIASNSAWLSSGFFSTILKKDVSMLEAQANKDIPRLFPVQELGKETQGVDFYLNRDPVARLLTDKGTVPNQSSLADMRQLLAEALPAWNQEERDKIIYCLDQNVSIEAYIALYPLLSRHGLRLLETAQKPEVVTSIQINTAPVVEMETKRMFYLFDEEDFNKDRCLAKIQLSLNIQFGKTGISEKWSWQVV